LPLPCIGWSIGQTLCSTFHEILVHYFPAKLAPLKLRRRRRYEQTLHNVPPCSSAAACLANICQPRCQLLCHAGLDGGMPSPPRLRQPRWPARRSSIVALAVGALALPRCCVYMLRSTRTAIKIDRLLPLRIDGQIASSTAAVPRPARVSLTRQWNVTPHGAEHALLRCNGGSNVPSARVATWEVRAPAAAPSANDVSPAEYFQITRRESARAS
jgi:hypothetical protein